MSPFIFAMLLRKTAKRDGSQVEKAAERSRLVVNRRAIYRRGVVEGRERVEDGKADGPDRRTRIAFQWAQRVRKSVSWIPRG